VLEELRRAAPMRSRVTVWKAPSERLQVLLYADAVQAAAAIVYALSPEAVEPHGGFPPFQPRRLQHELVELMQRTCLATDAVAPVAYGGLVLEYRRDSASAPLRMWVGAVPPSYPFKEAALVLLDGHRGGTLVSSGGEHAPRVTLLHAVLAAAAAGRGAAEVE
jgi:hypothetical protein